MQGSDVKGHCLCGAIRWAYSGAPLFQGYCHCDSCRRNCGAPVTAFIGVEKAAFRWMGAVPGKFVSSPGKSRFFCKTCGSPVAYTTDKFPDEIHLYAVHLDDPSAFRPKEHYHKDEALNWGGLAELHVVDGAG